MKNLIFVIVPFLFFSCYENETFDPAGDDVYYNYTITYSGDCNFITIHNSKNIESPGFIYNELPHEYIQSGTIKTTIDNTPLIDRRVVKHTGDTTTISMEINIDGQPIQSYSCSDPYCEISN